MAEGYLFVDHRASPGLPEEIARRAGYDPTLCREGKLFETATLRCAHCAGHTIVSAHERDKARGHCFQCNRFVCDVCVGRMCQPDYVHVPFAKLVDIAKDAEAKNLPFDPLTILRR